ncbi:hypothetical protein [Postechiella marina]
MKKTLIFISVLTLCSHVYGQERIRKNALGMRFGVNDGFEGELNYQRYLDISKNFRLESGLAFNLEANNLDYLKFVNTLQYVGDFIGDYKFYLGAGGGFGNYKIDDKNENEFILTGIAGLEWTSSLPILFSVDLRPEYRKNPQFEKDVFYNLGFSIRYQF